VSDRGQKINDQKRKDPLPFEICIFRNSPLDRHGDRIIFVAMILTFVSVAFASAAEF
jgi:hypothetical protein